MFPREKSRYYECIKKRKCDDICGELFRQKSAGELVAKMSKTTNKHQMDILINRMVANPAMARGFFKGSIDERNSFWRNLEAELNSAGPPIKSVPEWKKVWADQRKYVRQKAAQNLKARNATGGGPNLEVKFSALEEAIYNVVAMEESVEGVGTKFGLSTSNPAPQNSSSSYLARQLNESQDKNSAKENVEPVNMEWVPDGDYQPTPKKAKTTPREQPTQKSSLAADSLKQELIIQKEICEAVKQQKENTKKVYRGIERLCDYKKEELAEQKRHNLQMEQLRLREVEDKIEKNRRIIELEELKNAFQ